MFFFRRYIYTLNVNFFSHAYNENLPVEFQFLLHGCAVAVGTLRVHQT